MDTRYLPLVPHDIKFRILVIGKANAGMTSILRRVCDTTESPEIYRLGRRGKRERVYLDPTMERGVHNIEDEITFANHNGYVFHDSRGLESGSEVELKLVQEFVRRRSRERRLKDRLHAIWYCIPMDNDRPSLDLRHFYEVCPDGNIPVIPVFTIYDQLRLDVNMKPEDRGGDPALLSAEAEENFRKQYYYYLNLFKELTPFVRLEREIESAHREVDSVRAELISASGNPAIYVVHNDIPTAASRTIFVCAQDDFREVQHVSSSANVSSSTGDVITGDEGIAGPSSLASDLEAGSDEVTATVVDPPPLRLSARRVLTYFVKKHPKVVSTVSTVFITMGGIVLLPGVSECIGGKIFTPNAVLATGAIAVAVGKWLKSAVDSAASLADQAQPIDHVVAENVDSESIGQVERSSGHSLGK